MIKIKINEVRRSEYSADYLSAGEVHEPQRYANAGMEENCGCGTCEACGPSKKIIVRILSNEAADKLHGGTADNMPKSKFNKKELSMGIDDEKEHTDDEDVASEIARDHLANDPNYYTHAKEAGLDEKKDRCYKLAKQKYDVFGYNVEEVDNKPITDVIVTSLEHRGNGGRAYKVIVNGKYYGALREDILLDTILNAGIEIGGKLKGEYIWAKIGSAMKLIRTNSALHEEMLKSTEMNSLNKIKNLQVGRIYESKTQRLIYLGKVNSTEVDFVEKQNGNSYYKRSSNLIDGKLVTKPVSGMLFYEIVSYQKDINAMEIDAYRFDIKKSHTLRVDTGIDAKIPVNWLDDLKKSIYDDSIKASNKYNEVKNSKFYEVYYMTHYSKIANIDKMHPAFERALNL